MLKTASRKITAAAFSALLVAMFALAGCGSSQPAPSAAGSSSSSSAAIESSSSAEEQASGDLVIGEESSGNASIVLANGTGSAIDGLGIAVAGAEAEPAELMSAGQTWADGDTAVVYFEPEGSGVYDLHVSIGDAAYVLHGFDADLIASADIHLEDGVAYVTYEQFGNPVSTQAEEAELAQAQAAAEAEAAAAAEAEAEAAAASEPVEQTYSYDSAPATSQPAQSDDACIDGGVVLR